MPTSRRAMCALALPAPPPIGGYSLLMSRIFIACCGQRRDAARRSWLIQRRREYRARVRAGHEYFHAGIVQRNDRLVLAQQRLRHVFRPGIVLLDEVAALHTEVLLVRNDG